jgi:hypothetical protein
MKAALASIAILLSLTGCVGTIEQKVQPVALSGNEPREICLIENAAVHHEFLASYKKALSKRNLAVRLLPPGTALGGCPLMTTYDAKWTWDLALYLYYANLKVYHNNRLEGEALYDAAKGGTKTEKFINAETKIQELTDQLFPG